MMTSAKVKVAVAGAALAVMGAGGVFTLNRASGQARDAAAPAVAPVQAEAPATAPADARARLKNGVAVELHGVAEHPSTGRKWWAADGSPLGRAPYHHMDKRITPWGMSDANRNALGREEAEVAREIAVRVDRKVDGQPEPATLRWYVGIVGGTKGMPNVEDEANRIIPNMHGLPVRLPGSMSGPATLRIDVAAGPWNTLFVAPAATGGSRRGDDGTFDLEVSEANGASQFVFSRTGIKRGLDERIVAIDTSGQSHSLVLHRTTSNGADQTDTYHLPKPLASLKEVQFKQRPFDQWISFGGIALHPDQRSKISIATSDEPPSAKVK